MINLARIVSLRAYKTNRYFDDILNSTPKSVESVTIDSDGRWSVAAESLNTPVGDSSDDENGFRVVDIEGGRSSRSVGRSSGPSGLITPSSNSRDESLPASRPNNKRPIIDLTLSDDEDEPPRPVKRNNVTQTPTPRFGAPDPAMNPYALVGNSMPRF